MSTFIDSLTAIQTAVRDGAKWWQWKATLAELWYQPEDQSINNLNAFVKEGYEVRLVPEPPKPRCWDRESDVPFPCWIQGETASGMISMLVVATTSKGIIVNDRSGVVMLFWGELKVQCRKYSTDRVTFHPCTCAVE